MEPARVSAMPHVPAADRGSAGSPERGRGGSRYRRGWQL